MINKAINFDDIFHKIHSNYVYILSGDMVFNGSVFDKALKTHEGKKHIKQSVHEKSSEVASQGQETSNSSKPNNRGGNGGFGDGR